MKLKDLLEQVTAKAKAYEMSLSGKYDPKVRGTATAFQKDLIASGVTNSNATAAGLWRDNKRTAEKAVAAPSQPTQAPKQLTQVPKATPTAPVNTKSTQEEMDAIQLAKEARRLGYKVSLVSSGPNDYTVTLGWDWDESKLYPKLEDFISKHNLWNVPLAASVSGAGVKVVSF